MSGRAWRRGAAPLTPPEAGRRLLSWRALRPLGEAATERDLFVTGGSVRDRLLGLPTHDLDLIADDDARQAALRLASRLSAHAFPLGHPPLVTWRVAASPLSLDVAEMQGGLEEDVLRRDFTVNALVWRLPRGPLLDLVGGLDDLGAGRIRVVREVNLRDDPLRVLRGIRLLATRPMLRLTAETQGQLTAAAPGLTTVARERIVEELRACMLGPAVERALLLAGRGGILSVLLPGWERPDAAARAAARAARLAEATRGRGLLALAAGAVAPAALALPAGLDCGEWDEQAAAAALGGAGWPERSAQRLARAAGLGETLARLLDVGDRAACRALLSDSGDAVPLALAWLRAASDRAEEAALLLAWWRGFRARPPLLSGDEIAALLGLGAGPARAAAVRALRAAQARGDVRTKAQARRFLLH